MKLQVICSSKTVFCFQQDWMLSTILEALGVREAAIGDEYMPRYNGLILIDLYEMYGQPSVTVRRASAWDQESIQVHYRKYPNSEELFPVSQYVRNCTHKFSGCTLESVL